LHWKKNNFCLIYIFLFNFWKRYDLKFKINFSILLIMYYPLMKSDVWCMLWEKTWEYVKVKVIIHLPAVWKSKVKRWITKGFLQTYFYGLYMENHTLICKVIVQQTHNGYLYIVNYLSTYLTIHACMHVYVSTVLYFI
jgi:hypothetical protein